MNLFKSFLLAGFECTNAKVKNRERIDMMKETKHDEMFEEDYKLIMDAGMMGVREGVAWNKVDNGSGDYDFARYEKLMKSGSEKGIQQIWDLSHFDYPDYLDPFGEEMIEAFARYSQAFIKVLRKYYPDQWLFIVPINEISFFAWIGADKGWWAPYKRGLNNGFRFKKQLVRASIAAMDAIKKVDGKVKFIHTDPFMRRKAREPANTMAKRKVKNFNESYRFETWDMLAGILCPELGGDPKYLDIIGINYYIHNQEWVTSLGNYKIGYQMMDWDSAERISLAMMIKQIYLRYDKPMLISETGCFGEMRTPWWERTLAEVKDALDMKLPVLGVCAYPVLDRPKKVNYLASNSGLWDFNYDDETCKRYPHEKALAMIKKQMGTLFVKIDE